MSGISRHARIFPGVAPAGKDSRAVRPEDGTTGAIKPQVIA
jgi:hypothetical protein